MERSRCMYQRLSGNVTWIQTPEIRPSAPNPVVGPHCGGASSKSKFAWINPCNQPNHDNLRLVDLTSRKLRPAAQQRHTSPCVSEVSSLRQEGEDSYNLAPQRPACKGRLTRGLR
jgi:hypothetical protein